MRRGNLNFIIYALLMLILVVTLYLVFSSKMFEKNPPKIIIENEIFWNLKAPLPIQITDDGGMKSTRITLNDGIKNHELLNQNYENPLKILDLNISLPKASFIEKKSQYQLNIEAIDSSKWGFFTGNKTTKQIKIVIDNK